MAHFLCSGISWFPVRQKLFHFGGQTVVSFSGSFCLFNPNLEVFLWYALNLGTQGVLLVLVSGFMGFSLDPGLGTNRQLPRLLSHFQVVFSWVGTWILAIWDWGGLWIRDFLGPGSLRSYSFKFLLKRNRHAHAMHTHKSTNTHIPLHIHAHSYR